MNGNEVIAALSSFTVEIEFFLSSTGSERWDPEVLKLWVLKRDDDGCRRGDLKNILGSPENRESTSNGLAGKLLVCKLVD